MEYGYCRISTRKQNIERQIRNILKEYPNAKIVQEIYTGTKVYGRPEWEKLRKKLKSGDIVIFDSVSRMSRDADAGFQLYKTLYKEEIQLVFLKEPHINTAVYQNALKKNISLTGTNVDLILKGINEYLLTVAEEQIRLAFLQSEKEVEDLRQRTKEGIETARLNHKQIGGVPGRKLVTKKSQTTKEIIRKHSKDFGGSLKDTEVMKLAGVARNSYYKYKRELILELCSTK